MDEREPEKIVLPEKLQLDMLEFFMRTSIPRIAKEKRLQAEKAASEKQEKP